MTGRGAVGIPSRLAIGPATQRLTLVASVRRKQHLHFAEVAIRDGERRVALVELVLAAGQD